METIEVLQPQLGGSVSEVALQLTPAGAVKMEADRMGEVYVSQDYDFAAAHRLHVESMSDEDNRAVFGKCNNPAGHGHNYRLRVVVRGAVDGEGRTASLDDLDALVDESIINELDHKHLNHDVAWFEGLNPTVENITKVIYEKLAGAISSSSAGYTLDEVTVWETEKTRCVYRG
ncbi:MAG: 6-carboxytetrahydropterin synthase [Planctomycetota bacterium]|jgi:6-pyruvoyltetrahydropterin/6-carboxytetrahydropterin synthase